MKIKKLPVGLSVFLFAAASAFASLDPHAPDNETPLQNQRIALSFARAVDVSRSAVRVFGPDGEIVVGTPLRGSAMRDLFIPVGHPLRPGRYTLFFTGYSTTGQRLSGSTIFSVPPVPSDGKSDDRLPLPNLYGAR